MTGVSRFLEKRLSLILNSSRQTTAIDPPLFLFAMPAPRDITRLHRQPLGSA